MIASYWSYLVPLSLIRYWPSIGPSFGPVLAQFWPLRVMGFGPGLKPIPIFSLPNNENKVDGILIKIFFIEFIKYRLIISIINMQFPTYVLISFVLDVNSVSMLVFTENTSLNS
jgi:hypothetical protein